MEKDILNILLEYKQIQNSKKELKTLFKEALADYGFKEKSKGILQGLETNFATNVEPFLQEMQNLKCTGRFTSGKRPKGKNPNSYHITGQALDMTFDSDSCYCKAMDVCSRYSDIYCLDERKKITQDWTAPHLHISIPEKTKKTVACNLNSPEAKGTYSSEEDKLGEFGQVDTGLFDVAKSLATNVFKGIIPDEPEDLQEAVNFGKNISKKYGDIIIPASDNKKIVSPVEGKVVTISDPNCTNSVGIRTADGNYTLKYCNVDTVSVSSGDPVFPGSLLGYTGNDDVLVSVLDITKRRVDSKVLDKVSGKQTTGNSDEDKYSSDNKKPPKLGGDDYDDEKYKPEQTYPDAALAALFGLPFLPFQNKYDKKTGKLIKKNWGSPTEKRQPDKSSWFRSPTEKKINENIERIKKLLN